MFVFVFFIIQSEVTRSVQFVQDAPKKSLLKSSHRKKYI